MYVFSCVMDSMPGDSADEGPRGCLKIWRKVTF